MEAARVEILFERFVRRGDVRALGAVYDELAPSLLRVAMHLGRDSAEAEDLVQATFVTAIERAGAWRSDMRVEPWLAGILGNHARNAARSAARAPDVRRVHRPTTLGPEESAHAGELDVALDRALAELPDAFRPVLVLRLRHGLTTAEIAVALGRPAGTVRTQLARGLDVVRRALPAGLAGAFAATCARPARGLDAIRELLVEHAASLAPASHAAGVVGGGLLVKKWIALVLVVVLATCGWMWWGSASSRDAVRATAGGVDAGAGRVLATGERASSDRDGLERASGADAEARREELARGAASPIVAAPKRSTTRIAIVARYEGDREPEPASGALLVLTRTLPGAFPLDERSLVADDEGRVELEGEPPGSVFVRGVQGGDAYGELRAEEELALVVSIPHGVDVEGRVVDEHGDGVGGAQVWLSNAATYNVGRVVAVADAGGAFRLRSVGPRRWIAARAKGRALSYLQELRGAPGDVARVTIELDVLGARLAGRVVDRAGAPIAGASVLVGDEDVAARRTLANGLSAPSGAPELARTDADGRFVVENAPRGTCVVQARAPGFAPASVDAEVAERGGDAEIMLDRGATIAGVATDANGAPIGLVELRAGEPGRFASALAHTDDRGRYELAGLPPREITVTATTLEQSRVELTVRLAPGERRVWDPRFGADASGSVIRGLVVDEHDAPLAGWGVVAFVEGRHAGAASSSPPTDLDGAFALRAEPERSYRLHVHAPEEWSRFPRAILTSVRAGGDPLRVVVEDDDRARGRIVGAVADARGEPEADAEVLVHHVELDLWTQAKPEGRDARFEIARAPPGRVTVTVRSQSHPWIDVGARDVRAGEELDLGTLRFADSGRVTGSITGVSDDVLKNVRLVISDERGAWKGTASIAGNELRSSALAPGKYVLLAQGDGVEDARVSFAIDAGREERVRIELRAAGSRLVACDMTGIAERPEWVTFAVLDADRNTVCIRSVRTSDAVGDVVQSIVWMAPGSHVLRVLAAKGPSTEIPFVQRGTGREEDLRVASGALGPR